MRAAVLAGPGQVEIVERPVPELLPGSCLVAVERCGIGGPDLVAWSTGKTPAPAWFGHEWSGRVVAVGEASYGRFVGERVVGAVPAPCGICTPCLAGFGAVCELVLAMIVGTDGCAADHGAFAEVTRVDSRRLHRLPEGVDFADGALAEPGAVAAHAVRRANPSLGDVVVVVGAGTVGLLVAELARLAGSSRIAVLEIEPERRELACDLGANAAFGTASDLERWLSTQGHGLGADIVFDCAGGQPAMTSSLTAVRSGGLVVLVGFTPDEAVIPAGQLLSREVTVSSSLGYTIADVHRALDLMADDRFRVSRLYGRTIGFAELPAVFEEMSSQRGRHPKVLFSPNPV